MLQINTFHDTNKLIRLNTAALSFFQLLIFGVKANDFYIEKISGINSIPNGRDDQSSKWPIT